MKSNASSEKISIIPPATILRCSIRQVCEHGFFRGYCVGNFDKDGRDADLAKYTGTDGDQGLVVCAEMASRAKVMEEIADFTEQAAELAEKRGLVCVSAERTPDGLVLSATSLSPKSDFQDAEQPKADADPPKASKAKGSKKKAKEPVPSDNAGE